MLEGSQTEGSETTTDGSDCIVAPTLGRRRFWWEAERPVQFGECGDTLITLERLSGDCEDIRC